MGEPEEAFLRKPQYVELRLEHVAGRGKQPGGPKETPLGNKGSEMWLKAGRTPIVQTTTFRDAFEA